MAIKGNSKRLVDEIDDEDYFNRNKVLPEQDMVDDLDKQTIEDERQKRAKYDALKSIIGRK